MTKIKENKPTDYNRLFVGNHVQNIKDKDAKRFAWEYEIRRDRRLSRLSIQEIEIVENERKDVGKPIVFDDIYCKLTRFQAREFVRNVKK